MFIRLIRLVAHSLTLRSFLFLICAGYLIAFSEVFLGLSRDITERLLLATFIISILLAIFVDIRRYISK